VSDAALDAESRLYEMLQAISGGQGIRIREIMSENQERRELLPVPREKVEQPTPTTPRMKTFVGDHSRPRRRRPSAVIIDWCQGGSQTISTVASSTPSSMSRRC